MSGTDERLGLPIRLFDEDNLPYTANNPMPVSLEESEGDEINDFQQDDDVTKVVGAVVTTVNHDYEVSVGKTMQVEQFIFGGSGRAKFELQIETGIATDLWTTLAVGMTSVSKLSDQITLKRAQKVAAGVRVRIAKSNLDNSEHNLYSTLVGLEK